MKRGTHRDHQFDRFSNRSKSRGGGPGIQRWRVNTLDVVQIKFRDKRQVEPDFFAASRQPRDVIPTRLHPLVLYIAEPAPEHWHPVSVTHSTRLPYQIVDQPLKGIKTNGPRSVGHEIRQRVDVV